MLVLIRGAGDLASGIALRLHHAHLSVVMTDLPQPTAIRRTVCFSQAIVYGSMTVEDVTARFCAAPENAAVILAAGEIPVLPDPEAKCRTALRPDVVVDAILAKKNLGTRITDAPCVIGVGPGFTAGKDCHAAVETMRGHTRPGAVSRLSPAEHEHSRPYRRLCRRARAARPGGRHFCAEARDRRVRPHR